MRDLFVEIWESVKRNKLRTSLTGFAVAWGIFMIIVLLGAGNGLMNAFLRDSEDVITNVMTVYGGETSKPYAGYKEGRYISLMKRDMDLTAGPLFKDHIDNVLARLTRSGFNMVYGQKSFSVELTGCYPLQQQQAGFKILAGRFINQKDIDEMRKVVVITDDQARNYLKGGTNYKSLIGRRVNINDFSYVIVGVREGFENEGDSAVYLPFTTMVTQFNTGEWLDVLSFTFHGLETEEENKAFEKYYKSVIAGAHQAAPDDESVVWISNRFTQNMQVNKATGMLNTALWIVGLFTLLSGIVGVSNIMLITVKERTHEFGIRKAIGARPMEITKLIVSESIVITALFGYIGMFMGMVACEILDKTVGSASVDIMGMSMKVLSNPTVGLDVAIEATLVLVIAGTIAGFFPAHNATKIRPIEALRSE